MAIPANVARLGYGPAGVRDGTAVRALMGLPQHGCRRYQGDCGLWADAGAQVPGGSGGNGQPVGRTARRPVPGRIPLAGPAAVHAPSALRHVSGSCRTQLGAYAVEFALIFMVFFSVLYGIMMYGMLFTAQQSLNLAA